MKPTEKSKGIEDFLNGQALSVFGLSRTEAIEANKCVSCKSDVTQVFESWPQDDQNEYLISGFCKKCFRDLVMSAVTGEQA